MEGSVYGPHGPRVMSINVTLIPSERTFTVERDEPILAAAIRQGIGLPYGCRDGACGSCKSRLMEGRVVEVAYQRLGASGAQGGTALRGRGQGQDVPKRSQSLQHAQTHIATADDQQGRTTKSAVWRHRGLIRSKMEGSVYGPHGPRVMSINVTLIPSERTFTVERDEPILAAAIRQGIGLPYGCRDGACGSCKSRLMEGRVIHGAHQAKALSEAEEAAGYLLPCCATPQTDCVIEARSVTAEGQFPILKLPSRVLSIDKPTADVAIVKLQLPATQNLQYRAGQYVEFIMRDGARRSYSMANAPSRLGTPPAIELHIRHMPGGRFTDHVFGAMKEKEILRMEGPFGTFFLREDSTKPIVLLASGTGFAPIKALIEQMQDRDIQRPTVLYWGCRSRADLYLHEWTLEAAAKMPQLRYVPVLSEPQPQDSWTGRTGLVHQAVMADLPDLSQHQVYACGVPIMVESAQRDFVQRCGLPAEEFYADSFTSEADKVQGA